MIIQIYTVKATKLDALYIDVDFVWDLIYVSSKIMYSSSFDSWSGVLKIPVTIVDSFPEVFIFHLKTANECFMAVLYLFLDSLFVLFKLIFAVSMGLIQFVVGLVCFYHKSEPSIMSSLHIMPFVDKSILVPKVVI